jgi:RNA ligase
MTVTATPLHDVLDHALLDAMVAQGFVRVQRHPSRPLSIYNYTEACQYGSVWNPVTLACRGLIVDATGGILSRPFSKFFNHGAPDAPILNFDERVTVTDKADGSLGVLYPDGDGWAVATRGSFASDQALHATRLLRSRYADFVPPAGLTVLVEIIYPSNRIVLDYEGLDDLVLLGAVEIATGRSYGPEAVPLWPGPVIERLDYATLAEALAAPPRANREGLVVHVPSLDVRVKIKYEEYVRLHRIVTGLNARVVWEHIAGGLPVVALAETLPDEFHRWVDDVARALEAEVAAGVDRVEATYAEIVATLPEGWGRKEFALRAVRHDERGLLFLRLDGRDVRSMLWQRVRPEADWTPHGRTRADDDA